MIQSRCGLADELTTRGTSDGGELCFFVASVVQPPQRIHQRPPRRIPTTYAARAPRQTQCANSTPAPLSRPGSTSRRKSPAPFIGIDLRRALLSRGNDSPRRKQNGGCSSSTSRVARRFPDFRREVLICVHLRHLWGMLPSPDSPRCVYWP